MTPRSSFLAHFLPVGYVEPANNEKTLPPPELRGEALRVPTFYSLDTAFGNTIYRLPLT
jgi:hypothetical protein